MRSLFVSVFVVNILSIQSGHRHVLQRYGGPNIYRYKSTQGSQYNQGHINTDEELESSEQDTNNAGWLQPSILIIGSGTLGIFYPSLGPYRKSSLLKPLSSTSASQQTFTQKPTTNTSPQPESPIASQSPPSFMNECVCTPFFSCYDDETSSNLTGVVNDRILVPTCHVTQKTCPNLNDVCCCNREPPSSSTSSAQPQTQPPSPSEVPTSKDSCNCRPRTECFDYEEGITNMKLEMEVCPEPNHVCCHEFVLPDNHHVPSLETTTLSLEPMSQAVIPSGIPHSTNVSECICTPFYKCYDDETSSNLTGLVNDRISCLSSEVCCHNLIPPSGNIEAVEDCSGTCKPIKECPGLSLTLQEAQSGNSNATQTLRNLVCSKSKESGTFNVCCT